MNQSQYADHLIDIYLAGITSITNDAGWEGDSMLSRLIQFHGQIPMGTGNDQSNLSMILSIDKLREQHALFDSVRRVIGNMLGTYDEADKILSLLSKRYYQGINERTKKRYTDRDRICNIGFAPIRIPGDGLEASAWETAERRYRRRINVAKELLLDKMQIAA